MSVYCRTFQVTRLSCGNLLLRVFCSYSGYEKWSDLFWCLRNNFDVNWRCSREVIISGILCMWEAESFLGELEADMWCPEMKCFWHRWIESIILSKRLEAHQVDLYVIVYFLYVPSTTLLHIRKGHTCKCFRDSGAPMVFFRRNPRLLFGILQDIKYANPN